MRHDHRYVWLDFLRGLAAVAICGSHLRNAMIVDYSSLASASVLERAFYVMTGGVAHQAVLVFFVLSGCFVGGAILRNRHAFDPVRYVTGRLTRFWVVLIPALVCTAMIDSVTRIYAPDVLAGVYKPTWHSGPSDALPCSSTLKTFFANVFFLQTVVAPVFGTNGPLWTLANEFWYYVLFPLFFVAAYGQVKRGALSPVARVLLGAVGLALLLWLPVSFAAGFVIWTMGVGVAAVQGRLSSKAAMGMLVAGTVAFVLALALARFAALGVAGDFLVGATCSLLVVGILNRPAGRVGPGLFDRVSVHLSEFSFSLYVIHFPLVALIGGVVYPHHKLLPTAQNVAAFGLWLTVLVGVGYGFYLCFERHTEDVRRWVDNLLVARAAGLGRRVRQGLSRRGAL